MMAKFHKRFQSLMLFIIACCLLSIPIGGWIVYEKYQDISQELEGVFDFSSYNDDEVKD